jgi:hypothetical protein
MKLFVAVLLVIVLVGCATVGSKVGQNMTEIPKGKGIVLFSTGADKTNLAFSTGLRLVQAESRKVYDKVIVNIDYPFTSDFPDRHGHVRSLTLPAGRYFLIPKSGNPAFCLTSYPTYEFSVEPGGITYIGSFQISANRLKWDATSQNRDIDYFLRKNPALVTHTIEKQSVNIGTVQIDNCDSNTFMRGIIWDSP